MWIAMCWCIKAAKVFAVAMKDKVQPSKGRFCQSKADSANGRQVLPVEGRILSTRRQLCRQRTDFCQWQQVVPVKSRFFVSVVPTNRADSANGRQLLPVKTRSLCQVVSRKGG